MDACHAFLFLSRTFRDSVTVIIIHSLPSEKREHRALLCSAELPLQLQLQQNREALSYHRCRGGIVLFSDIPFPISFACLFLFFLFFFCFLPHSLPSPSPAPSDIGASNIVVAEDGGATL